MERERGSERERESIPRTTSRVLPATAYRLWRQLSAERGDGGETLDRNYHLPSHSRRLQQLSASPIRSVEKNPKNTKKHEIFNIFFKSNSTTPNTAFQKSCQTSTQTPRAERYVTELSGAVVHIFLGFQRGGNSRACGVRCRVIVLW